VQAGWLVLDRRRALVRHGPQPLERSLADLAIVADALR
jgi:hypothetical protein